MRTSLVSPLTLVLAAFLAAPVLAAPSQGPVTLAVPSASNSTVPSCLLTTPGGNIAFTVVVRDLANNPVVNSLVVVDYSLCTGFTPCPQGGGAPADNYVLDLPSKTIRGFTGAAPPGQATFNIRAGGGCSSNLINVYADGVFFRSIRAASADQNGDLVVDGADVAAVTAKIGTTDLTGDLNCDGAVTLADQGLVASYVGVNCLHPTDVRTRTWGVLKTIYR